MPQMDKQRAAEAEQGGGIFESYRKMKASAREIQNMVGPLERAVRERSRTWWVGGSWVGGLVGWWVGGSVGRWVGGSVVCGRW